MDRHTEQQVEDANHRRSPEAMVIFEAIRNEGIHELERPASSLIWSGLAAGLSMGFSMIAQGLIGYYLPEASWTPLITKLGYSIGFLIVILGRQQLFTENTLTPVLQLLKRKSLFVFTKLMRLWSIVFFANILGALLFALAVAKVPVFAPDVYHEFDALAHEIMFNSFGVTFARAIFTGWLVALIIWLLPFAQEGRIWIITSLSYLIGIAHFPHIIAGSVDGFYGIFAHEIAVGNFIIHFFIPTLIGNIVGGVALVAVIGYAQIRYEHHL